MPPEDPPSTLCSPSPGLRQTAPWSPARPCTHTFAWVSSVRFDGCVVIQDAPGASKRRARRAWSCDVELRRGDLVLVATDGHFHYILALLHRRPIQSLQLCDPAFAQAANDAA